MDNNTESINKLYGQNADKSLNNTTLNKNSRYKSRLEHPNESKKYIKEMQEMEDKNEKRTNLFSSLLFICVLLIVGGFSLRTFVFKPNVTLYATSPNTETNNSITSDDDIINDSNIANKTDDSSNNQSSETVINDDNSNSDDITTNNENNSSNTDTQNNISNTIVSTGANLNSILYQYILDDTNRQESLDRALELNEGSSSGVNIFYLSELMRNSGLTVPEYTQNTSQLIDYLKSEGWVVYYDYNLLEKGDICFTTELSGMPGVPSHSYIFMGWVEEGKTDYAYICDGQITQYDRTIHTRNIDFATQQKEKFNFFLRK